jgi:hypothetical protein
MRIPTAIRTAALALAAVAAIGAAGCGSGNDTAEKLQKQGQQLQERGRALQEKASTIARQVQEGTVDPEAAARELQRDADAMTDEAKGVANDAIDSVKDDAHIPDEAKQQLEQAQEQLKEAGN